MDSSKFAIGAFCSIALCLWFIKNTFPFFVNKQQHQHWQQQQQQHQRKQQQHQHWQQHPSAKFVLPTLKMPHNKSHLTSGDKSAALLQTLTIFLCMC